MKILLLEDNKLLGESLEKLLTLDDHDVTWLENGKQGMLEFSMNSVADDKPYDIIVTDYSMPVMNGLEFIEKLREYNKTIRVILFTSDYYVKNIINESMKIDKVIMKDIEELQNVLQKLENSTNGYSGGKISVGEF